MVSSFLRQQQVWNVETALCNNVAFFALSVARLFNLFNVRAYDENFFKNQVTVNKYVWFAPAFCIGSLIAACFIPGLKDILSLQELDAQLWLLILAAALSSFGLIQLLK